MNSTIEMILPYRIAYIRQVGPYGTGNVKAMERLKDWANLNQLFNEKTIIFGIAHDNPETTKPENCRYDTCLVIPDDYYIRGEYICNGVISGGHYAVFTIKHTAEDIKNAWVEIFQELSTHEYQFDTTRPVLERYKVEMVNKHLCEICVPILK